jgi:uncharacterized membrane protein
MAGLFYAFSVALMPGLDDIPATHAIRAMQSMNRKVLNPLFLTSFLVAPLAALVTGALLLVIGRPAALLSFLAGATYVLGAFVPTGLVNVPMNTALDAEAPAALQEAAAVQRWSAYAARWTRWNTLRTGFSATSLLLIGLALCAWGRR